ncbi:MAG TPA: AIM24 family protein [Fimbriimonadaceae bacterium]|nr:AIM24 family protein [Fimbriimonadaceae bacterium]
MAVPVLLPTNVQDESFAQVTYHVQGEIVPVLVTEVGPNPVYFEHNVLLWKDPTLNVVVKPLSGGFKRLIAGMPLIMVETSGAGRIGFSRDGAGHVFGLHFSRGQGVDVREHQWLAATATLDYSFQRVKGVANIMLSGTGFFIDTFRCSGPEGILWLHGYGNVFEINLQPGEQIDIEPGAWIYKDQSVRMETVAQKLSTGIFASGGQFVFNRFYGPGRIGIQSMSLHLATSD